MTGRRLGCFTSLFIYFSFLLLTERGKHITPELELKRLLKCFINCLAIPN